MEKYEKVPLRELLEVIEQNLGFNINSFYEESIALIDSALIGVKKTHRLKWKKEDLKKQIKGYLKIVVKNIRHKILYQLFDDYIKEINEAIKDE